jgi:hypothetical protein
MGGSGAETLAEKGAAAWLGAGSFAGSDSLSGYVLVNSLYKAGATVKTTSSREKVGSWL